MRIITCCLRSRSCGSKFSTMLTRAPITYANKVVPATSLINAAIISWMLLAGVMRGNGVERRRCVVRVFVNPQPFRCEYHLPPTRSSAHADRVENGTHAQKHLGEGLHSARVDAGVTRSHQALIQLNALRKGSYSIARHNKTTCQRREHHIKDGVCNLNEEMKMSFPGSS